MKQFCLLFSILLGSSALATDLTGFAVYPSSDLKSYQAKLAPKMNDEKMAGAKLDNFGNHYTMITYREASGQAEIHEHLADLFVVQDGEATLVIGGEAVDAKTVSPGELRGSSIRGGERRKLGPGDIVHIPPGMPHQLLLDPGKHFTYFVMKIEAK